MYSRARRRGVATLLQKNFWPPSNEFLLRIWNKRIEAPNSLPRAGFPLYSPPRRYVPLPPRGH